MILKSLFGLDNEQVAKRLRNFCVYVVYSNNNELFEFI